MKSSTANQNPHGLPHQAGKDGIAIIGISGRYPGGANNPDLLWKNLCDGVDAVSKVKGDRWDKGWHHPDPQRRGRVYTDAGGFLDRIDGFDAEFFGLSPREVKRVDPQQRLLLELAWEAFEDAGIPARAQAGSQTGVFVGISSTDYAALDGGYADAYSNTGGAFSIAANRISYILDFHGPSFAVDTACSSSLVAIHQACRALLNGECGMALAGGVHVISHIHLWQGFAKASMLSPTGRCKSFDASGDGFVRAEGGGLILLKALAAAERDGDRILGVIVGSGVNSDGRTLGLSLPNGEAQEQLLRTVYGQCGANPEDVVYVEAHGTGTAVGDPIECGALGRVLGAPRNDGSRCLIGSVKSNIGHLEAASGIAGLTKALLALQHNQIPGNLHFNTPNPKIDFENWKLQVVDRQTPLPRRKKPALVGINSFGFGGTNGHVAIQEYRTSAPSEAKVEAKPASEPNILVISAATEPALKALAAEYVELLQQTTPAWEQICAGAATCRSALRYRLAVAATDREEALSKLQSYVAGTPTPALATGSAPAPTVPIAFVYSGNGPQWWGMGRELLAENKTFREELEAIDEIFQPLAGWSLLDEMRKPESESRMSLTEVAQPMLFAQQLGLTQVLREAGIEAAAVLGHSVGEAAAAWASGALSREQATQVIFHRSREQSKTAGLGKMAALGAGPEEAQKAIAEIPGWLELAAVNSPQAVTVAGAPDALEKLVQSMTSAGKFARLLQLNYPFHTKAMESIHDDLCEALKSLVPHNCSVPFISTVDGRPKSGPDLDAEYWYRNVREPVHFHEAVAHLLKESGFAVFIEIGPHPVLKDYIGQSAKALDLPVTALTTLRRPGSKGPEPESANLWTAICACHANGGGDLLRLYQRPNPVPKLPLYPWQRTRHWHGAVALPDHHVPTQREHELLGYRVPAADGVWENTLDLFQLPYLKDHVVQGSVLFPAAGYVALALEAGRQTYGKCTLDVEDLEISRPLVIPLHGDPLVQTYFNVKDGECEISSRAERDATDWTRQTRTRLSKRDTPSGLEPLNLAEISARMPVAVSAEQHYKTSIARGLNYGAAFQGVSKILMTSPNAEKREALAEIYLPFLDNADPDTYLSHPALLDSCIQVGISLVDQNEKNNASTIPVHIGKIRSIRPLTSRLFCHFVIKSESERSLLVDFHITDIDGHLLMDVQAARCQKVNFGQGPAAPMLTDWWRPAVAKSAAVAATSLPEPSAMKTLLAEDLQVIGKNNARDIFYREIRPAFERLAQAYAVKALATLEPGDAAFDQSRFARKAGIKRDQMALLGDVIRISAEAGQLQNNAGKWVWNKERTPEDPAELWRELFEKWPNYYAELLLALEMGERLPARLRGEPGHAPTALLDQAADTGPLESTYNQLARAALEKLVAQWPADRPIRVLEIAGGGGGFGACILPAFPSDRTDYLWTDPNEAAVGRAEHRFAAQRFVRCAALDWNADFVDRGQPRGYFDLVLAGSALDATTDPNDVLTHIQRVLAPGGLLLGMNAAQNAFEWLALEKRSQDWSAHLEAAGFETPAVIDDSASCETGQAPQRRILLSRLAPTTGGAKKAPAIATRQWLLLLEEDTTQSAFAAELSKTLQALGQTVQIAAAAPDAARAIREHASEEIVYVASKDINDNDSVETAQQRFWNVTQMVQALETLEARPKDCHLTFVTAGAFSTANGQGPIKPGQVALWGLGRVIGNEHPSLNMRLIDLHSAARGAAEAQSLAAELAQRDDETEVQLASGYRYVNRGRLSHLQDFMPANSDERPFALDFQPHGGLDSLHLREAHRAAPGPNDVEIAVEAAGLNFRDVLWVMGMLPEEAVEHGFSGPTIGMECAGRIERVGANVSGLKPGDRVVAFASDCFGSHVTTDAGAVAQIPDNVDLTAAATIPTAFLTAYYAFDHLARLEPGETVLIHGAAGGVGMAAIQIAKLKGAKVIGTAGSERKRRMLATLGVDYVLNSRTLEFADEVMKITGGVGVDVVLNSLAGEAITKSLQCLRPFGRFLEIGKRDLYGNSHIGLRPFRNNLSYFGIDADTLLVERPAVAHKLFKQLMAHFAAGELRPIPYQAIPVSRAAEAFRAMQQSRHVGKLVVAMNQAKHSSLVVARRTNPVKPGVTYLVTGGLAGFGFASAEWLVEQGATSLALVSRRGATGEEATLGIAKLEKMGASVRAFAADISDMAAVEQVLKTVRSEMAPLAGIVHAAAVIEAVMNMTIEQIERVFRPKMQGAWNLHTATLKDQLELFVMYSSSSTFVGNPGQAAYVAANLYLDTLALYRRSLGLPALSIGWGAIRDAGFLTRHQNVVEMLKTRTGLDATPAKEALADFARLTSVGAVRASVGRFDMQRVSKSLPGVRTPRFVPVVPKSAASQLASEETLAEMLKKVPEGERRAMVLARVKEHAARVLGTVAEQINADQPLGELGLDSLMAVELASGLERDLGQPVAVMQMLSAGTLSAISDLIMKILGLTVESEGSSPAPASPVRDRGKVLQELKS